MSRSDPAAGRATARPGVACPLAPSHRPHGRRLRRTVRARTQMPDVSWMRVTPRAAPCGPAGASRPVFQQLRARASAAFAPAPKNASDIVVGFSRARENITFTASLPSSGSRPPGGSCSRARSPVPHRGSRRCTAWRREPSTASMPGVTHKSVADALLSHHCYSRMRLRRRKPRRTPPAPADPLLGGGVSSVSRPGAHRESTHLECAASNSSHLDSEEDRQQQDDGQ